MIITPKLCLKVIDCLRRQAQPIFLGYRRIRFVSTHFLIQHNLIPISFCLIVDHQHYLERSWSIVLTKIFCWYFHIRCCNHCKQRNRAKSAQLCQRYQQCFVNGRLSMFDGKVSHVHALQVLRKSKVGISINFVTWCQVANRLVGIHCQNKPPCPKACWILASGPCSLHYPLDISKPVLRLFNFQWCCIWVFHSHWGM